MTSVHVIAACCSALALVSYADTAYTSASYVQSGLIAQWDGIDNVGTGTHDPTATTWKDLKGSLDMALTDKGSWTFNGNALYVSGNSGAGAQGTGATPAYKTIEVVYKMTDAGGRILFNSGHTTRFVVFDGDGTRLYFDGSTDTKRINCPFDMGAVCFAAATYDGSTVSNLYFDGEVQTGVAHKNTWGAGDGKVAVGDRSLSKSYPWTGEVFAIRLYDRALTAAELAENCAIDKARFLPPEDPPEAPLTSSSYVQDGLIGQYDGIDNQGMGTHDPTAAVWKDLAGDNDLTLTNSAAWCRGIGLRMNQTASSKAAAFGKTAAPLYKTIEVFFKESGRASRIMLWSGDRSRYVVFDHGNVTYPFVWAYFDGRAEVVKTGNRPTPYVKMQAYVPTSLVATYGANDEVADVYCDGVQRYCGTSVNDWGNGDGVFSLGGRVVTSSMSTGYGWEGEIYAIRFYNRVLTDEEIARNHAIDVKRFYTSALYDKTGMTSFWDAKENAGVGQYDETSTTWANLVSGGQDLTLNNSSWKSGSLCCVNTTKSGAYGTQPQTFTSMEIAFRSEKASANVWLFSGGVANYYCVLSTYRSQWADYEGLYGTIDFSYRGLHSLGTSRDVAKTNAYVDGVNTYYDKVRTPKRANDLDDWGPGANYVQVGARSSGQNFEGRIYSVRLYDTAISDPTMWCNSEIDRMRYENPLTWHGPLSEAVGDGIFEEYGNWVDVNQTVRIPDANHTVNLPLGTYKITLTGDRMVAAMSARNGNVEKWGRSIDTTLDMGGKAFSLLGDYQADASRGVQGNRYASLTLTNGTFKAEGVKIGALSERRPAPTAYDDFASGFKRGAGSFIMEGPNTTATIARTFRMEGPFTRLRVAGGATFTSKGLVALATQDRLSTYEAGVYDRAQIEFTGSNTTATVGTSGFYIHRDVDVTVSDGASLTMTGGYESFSPLGGTVNVLGRNYSTAPGNSSSFVVDNATVTLQGYPFVVGASLDTVADGGGASFTLQNNAKLAMKGSGMSRFVVGAGANNSTAFSQGNVLNVLDGSVFGYGEGGASARLEVGICGNTSFSGVNVSNATVNCVKLMAGSRYAPAASSNNFVNVMGETAKINVSGTGADSIYLRMGARLKFTIPENGFAETPVVTAGGVKVENDEDFFAVDPVKLVIDASAFKGDRVTLISCVSNSTYYLQRLVNNKVFVGKNRGKLSMEDNGTKLVYNKSGMLIIFR